MPKIIDYKIIQSSYNEKISAIVKEMIQDGWQPLGGICSTSNYGYQTMVRYEELEEKHWDGRRPKPNAGQTIG